MNCFEAFQVKPGSKIQLDNIDANFKDCYSNREEAQPIIDQLDKRIRAQQYLMYAEHKHSLLICLQGRDAAGKDGTINHVLGAMNPQGCTVTSFKQPSKEEAAHDFLWRCHKVTPAQGHVAIFNRSHYEDVLVQRVHNMVPESIWSRRYDHINHFEELLADQQTLVLKFFLHIDADEQLKRFKQRIDDPSKHWKISESDYTEASYWDPYTQAFEEVFKRCSKPHAPWFVIPANHKWFRNLAVASIVADAMESLSMSFPKPSVDINEIKRKYFKLDNLEEKEGLLESSTKSRKNG
ncbi:polyphosphate kinase 2 family protein [uncultured Microbulbifer sp.]|uniref:polyphosphate kinase 2 family protein n=1 Tax=uncultured Microbulbifer sp. TaxID=348147 RepID=UPI0026275D4D|nr:polyphosphate kinase 2 family protein [uncultured Microbulbifer sp.]